MSDIFYESHALQNSLLPFIYHRDSQAGRGDAFNWHENIEVLCFTEGKGIVLCSSGSYSVSGGDIFVVNSNCSHAIKNEDSCHYHCLIVDQSFYQKNGIPVLPIQPLIHDADLYQLFLNIDHYFSCAQASPWRNAEIRCAVLEFLIRVGQTHSVADGIISRDTPSENRVKQVVTFIRGNLSQKLTLDRLSALAGISKYHFSREFKALTGETVIDCINIMRCQEARRMIETGSTVSEAAMACGFDNLSYFTRTFKKYQGILPSKCPSASESAR